MTLVKRVASKLTSTLRHHGVEMHPDDIEGLAIDAITAMREPAPEMIAAAWAKIDLEKKRLGIARLGPGPGATDVWRAMIDAILAENQAISADQHREGE